PAHEAVLRLPEHVQPVRIMVADIVAHEAGGQVDGDLVAVDPGEGHVAEPAAVFDLADLLLQAAANASPLGRELLVCARNLPARLSAGLVQVAGIMSHASCLPWAGAALIGRLFCGAPR